MGPMFLFCLLYISVSKRHVEPITQPRARNNMYSDISCCWTYRVAQKPWYMHQILKQIPYSYKKTPINLPNDAQVSRFYVMTSFKWNDSTCGNIVIEVHTYFHSVKYFKHHLTFNNRISEVTKVDRYVYPCNINTWLGIVSQIVHYINCKQLKKEQRDRSKRWKSFYYSL